MGFRWEKTTVTKRNAKLLQNKLWTDCTFLVGKNAENFQAHKAILASASPVFETMFYGSLVENTNEGIRIEDIEAEIFSLMLKFIYTDELFLQSTTEAQHLYYASRKYMISQLTVDCIGYLDQNLNAFNALQIYEFSKFFELYCLTDPALKVMRTQTLAVINSPSFTEIRFSTLMTLLDQDYLEADALELFKALNILAEAKSFTNDNDMRNEFRPAVKKIRFLTISAKQFAEEAAFSKLLTTEEALGILASLNEPKNISRRYPKDFNSNICKQNEFDFLEYCLNVKYD